MKFYQSPLSIFASLYILASFYCLYLVLFNGMHADIVFLWLFLMGVIMIVIDHFLRRSGLNLFIKILIQSLIAVTPIVLVYLFLIGYIRF